MLLLRTDSLPNTEHWLYEPKLDGYRAVAFKRDGIVHLRSRNDNDFSGRYPGVVKRLAKVPENSVIDDEVIAFDDDGRPSFNALQNHAKSASDNRGRSPIVRPRTRWPSLRVLEQDTLGRRCCYVVLRQFGIRL
jgi:bifunctional non-homologous end joining protein LigD